MNSCGLSIISFILLSVLNSFTSSQLEYIYKKISPAVTLVQYTSEVTNQITGTVSRKDGVALGLLVSPNGLVLTPGYVEVEGVESFNFRVRLFIEGEEKEYSAIKLKKPDDVNVVLLKLQDIGGTQLPFVEFHDTPNLKVGSEIAMIGILGETLDYVRAITVARVGAIIGKPRVTYCIDENVRLGFVGGPVVNGDGNIVGVVGFDLSKAEGGEIYTRSGHPLIYQYALFKKYISSPPGVDESGGEQEAWLGVITQPLTDDFAEYWNLPKDGGLIVATVVNPSPASECGLKVGDVIKKFNGVTINAKYDRDVSSFTKLVREAGSGKRVEIEILRGGMPMTLYTTLQPRPKRSYEAEEFEWVAGGVTVREITPDMRISLGIDENVSGVIVYRVKSGSPAQLAKISRGMIIQAIGNRPIKNIGDFKDIINELSGVKPKEIPIFIRVGNISGFFRIQPIWED
ncbi:MAG: PDZ domain-containing protein [Candidatus Hydrogenedentes bacterium]|nr:PDZ domain-containing protein [Candidatus Hydrogenedentota bacterium]